MKMRSLSGLFVAVVLVGAALVPAPASADTLEVKLSGDRETPQGAPHVVQVKVVNRGTLPQTIALQFDLVDVEGKTPAIMFDDWTGSVPAGSTQTFEIDIVTAQFLARKGTFKVRAELSGIPIGNAHRFEVVNARIRVPKFTDVTAATGLSTTLRDFDCSRWAAGAAWADIEGDGDLDLYLPRVLDRAHMWVNDGSGHFTDEAEARGLGTTGALLGAAFADYDNDGDKDLYVTADGPNRLYENDGAGRFTDVAVAAGVDDNLASQSAAWGDYDNDGLLDLYVVNYGRCLPNGALEAHRDHLYRNEGDGTFSDQTILVEGDPASNSDGSTIGYGFQASWFDYDGDNDIDLYLANDNLRNAPDQNRLWRNDGATADGGWRFTDVTGPSGSAFGINSMGIGVADYDRDLDLDFAVSNVEPTVLARNNGDGTFTDVAALLGIDRPEQSPGHRSITWGLAFYDFNLDAWEDLYVAAGGLPANNRPQPNELFASDKKAGFYDLSAPSRTDNREITRGVAFADYDRDGRMDIFTVNQDAAPALYRNVTSKKKRHWLEVELTGTTSNRDACGAKVIVRTASGTDLLRQVFCGSTSLASGSDPALHFGLGRSATVANMTIVWPSGTTQTVDVPRVDRMVKVVEP